MEPYDDHDKKKDITSKQTYKNLPVYFTCQNCDYTGYTIVEQKTTYISYILMILFIFVFGIFFSIILMPLVILLTRNYFHKCPSCFKEVGSDNKVLGILNLTDKVISFNIGEFGVVLSRKIVLGIFLTIVLIITIYVQLSHGGGGHSHGPIVPTNENWNTFMTECGRESLDGQGIQKQLFCERKYVDKTVINWKGYVIRVEDFRNSLYSFMHHAVVILLKMEPSESEMFPDILLAIDSEKARQMDEVIASLNRGTEIGFNATIVTLGNELKTRHFHLVNLKKEDGYLEVPLHIHEHGRYADKPRFFRNALPNDAEPDQQNEPEPDH